MMYVKYFRSKARAGVARLDETDALYLVPPCAEADQLLGSLQAFGAPTLPKHCLLGVIAPTPGPGGAPGGASAATIKPVASVASSGDVQADAKTAPKEKVDANSTASADELKESMSSKTGADTKPTTDTDTDRDGQEMSQEALLDLFSNPELLRSLQNIDDSGAD